MRPLGNPSSSDATGNSSHHSNGSNGWSDTSSVNTNGNRFDADSRSNGVTSTSYSKEVPGTYQNGNSSSNGTASKGLVLARRPVSALTAVQTAAAGAAGSLSSQQNRDRIAAYVADSTQVSSSLL